MIENNTISIDLDYKQEDLHFFALYDYEHNPRSRKRFHFSISIMLIIVFVCWLILPVYRFFYYDGNYYLMRELIDRLPFFGLLALILTFSYKPTTKWVIKRNISQMLKSGKNASFKEHQYFIFNKEGLINKDRVSEVKINWSALEQIDIDASYLILYTTPVSAFIIPKRIFPDEISWQQFITKINEWYRSACPP